MQLNGFLEDVIGITKPWRVISAEFDGVDTVNVELEYVKSQRPEAPDCPECGSSERRTFPIAIDLLSFGLIRHVPVAVCLRDINRQTGTPLILFARRLSEIAFQFARCVKVRVLECRGIGPLCGPPPLINRFNLCVQRLR